MKSKTNEQGQLMLFEQPITKPANTCRNCANRQRHQCGGSIIQYCGVRKSNRTYNGLLKIKVTDPACAAFVPEKK